VLFSRFAKTRLVTPDEALPGRATRPYAVPATHAVLGTPLEGPWPAGLEVAYFALGCFWGAERVFWQTPGVYSTAVGYQGGATPHPTYDEVCSGMTGHTEAVQVVYDPAKVSYEKLLNVFWHNIDPTVKDRQFCDIGTQYRTGIFVSDDKQRQLAEASKAALEKAKPFKDAIVTPIVAATEFWPAEEYHQDYYVKNPVRYSYYRTGCGRDRRLAQLWGTSSH
jgi:peptide-methionine (S)-S-oxide reductase